MTRLTRPLMRLRPALLCAAGALALSSGESEARQGDCMDQIEALRASVANAPGSVTNQAEFNTALNHAEGWYEDGDMSNCRGWLDEAESLLAAPEEPAPQPEPEPEPEPETDEDAQAAAEAERERAEQAREDAAERAEEAREEAEERAEAAREEAEERAEEARERAEEQREEARERAEERREEARERAAERRERLAERREEREADKPERQAEDAPDRTASERRAREARREQRDGWLDRWLGGDDDETETAGSAEITGEDGFDPRVDPEPVEGAEDRLQVIDPAEGRSFDRPTRGVFTPSVNAEIAPAIPAVSEMSDLERAARRRLIAGPDTTLAEINARSAAEPRGWAGYGDGRSANASSDANADVLAVEAVRFNGEALSEEAREAVAEAAAIVDDNRRIAVRGDSFDAAFGERARQLVDALTEAGVSRGRVDVIWGRTYGDNPDALQLAVLEGSERY